MEDSCLKVWTARYILSTQPAFILKADPLQPQKILSRQKETDKHEKKHFQFVGGICLLFMLGACNASATLAPATNRTGFF
jgi:hypothetical protein